MPEVTISDETKLRVDEFKKVMESVNDEPLAFDEALELLISFGIDSMLEWLWSQVDPKVLVQSLQQLGARHPVEVYGFIVETMKHGEAVNRQRAKEEMNDRMGFRPQRSEPDEEDDV